LDDFVLGPPGHLVAREVWWCRGGVSSGSAEGPATILALLGIEFDSGETKTFAREKKS